jgi:hypothetical protein
MLLLLLFGWTWILYSQNPRYSVAPPMMMMMMMMMYSVVVVVVVVVVYRSETSFVVAVQKYR